MSEIKLGIGYGDIQFGMERDTIKKMLGKADEVELYSYSEEEEDLTEVWHYDELDLSLSFDEADHWKLVMIAVGDTNAHIAGEFLIDKTQEEIIAACEKSGLGAIDTEEVDEGQVLKIEEKSINFWMDEGLVSEIQFGPFWNGDDEPIFP